MSPGWADLTPVATRSSKRARSIYGATRRGGGVEYLPNRPRHLFVLTSGASPLRDGQHDGQVLSWSAVRGVWVTTVLLAIILTTTAAEGRVRQTLKLKFPALPVEPGDNVEACTFLRVKLPAAFDATSWELTERGSSATFRPLHLLVYMYTGTQLDAWPVRTPVPSRGCVAVGPDDRQSRQLIASGFVGASRAVMPSRVALRLSPQDGTIGFLLDAEWANDDVRRRKGRVGLVLHRAKRGTIARVAQPLLARSAESGLAVAPGTIRSTEDSTGALGAPADAFAPAGGGCVLGLTGHFRQRGRFFGVDLRDAQDAVIPPPVPYENPIEPTRTHWYGSTDFTDPGVLPTVLPVQAGEKLHWACWHDNGVERPQRLGCEESVGVPPGVALGAVGGGAAKPCTSTLDCPTTDPAYPTRTFTGACVPAVLTGSDLVDDEGCALAGFVYDPASGGGCDVSGEAPTS